MKALRSCRRCEDGKELICMDGNACIDAREAYGSTDGQYNSTSEREHSIPAPVTKKTPKKRRKGLGLCNSDGGRGFPVIRSSSRGLLEHKFTEKGTGR